MQSPPHELRPPLDAYLAWMRGRGSSPATLRAYTADLRQLDRWLAAAGVEPTAADDLMLRRYAAHLATLRYAPATAARKLSAARGAYTFMLDRGLIKRNPAALVPGPRQVRTLPATLSEPEVERLLDRPVAPEPRTSPTRAAMSTGRFDPWPRSRAGCATARSLSSCTDAAFAPPRRAGYG